MDFGIDFDNRIFYTHPGIFVARCCHIEIRKIYSPLRENCAQPLSLKFGQQGKLSEPGSGVVGSVNEDFERSHACMTDDTILVRENPWESVIVK